MVGGEPTPRERTRTKALPLLPRLTHTGPIS